MRLRSLPSVRDDFAPVRFTYQSGIESLEFQNIPREVADQAIADLHAIFKMTYLPSLFIGCDMRATDRKIRQLVVEEVAIAFNKNRMIAALCMLASAAISSGLLVAAFKRLF
jgi:hypothetical protein